MKIVDTNILNALREGDHDAFDTVFITFCGKIRNFIYGFLKSKDDAEELTQDIFVKLWINRESIDPEKSFSSYLYTMARNAVLNHLKHRDIQNAYINSLVEYDGSNYSEEILYAKEISLLVAMAVERMPVQRKKIYQMSRDEGLSNEEIALKLNISKRTVENQISLALKDLRTIITCFLAFFTTIY